MDSETSLSALVYAAIPSKGATWGDLVREVCPPSNEALEFCLKGLRSAKLVKLVANGDSGIWHRYTAAPKAPEPDNDWKRRPRAAVAGRAAKRPVDARTRYDKRGWRYCTAGEHYVPVNQFARGSCSDGYHAYCRACRKLQVRESRQ